MNGFLRGTLLAVLSGIALSLAGCVGGGGSSDPPGASAPTRESGMTTGSLSPTLDWTHAERSALIKSPPKMGFKENKKKAENLSLRPNWKPIA